MTSKLTRERLEQLADNNTICKVSWDERIELAQIALAAMDSESGCLPLDYLQGHKDGLEWAAQLAEANHPETGDWLYDDPIELAKAIRKGPDMPPVQPVADSEPVAYISKSDLDAGYPHILARRDFNKACTMAVYAAQPAPIVEREPIAWLNDAYLARGVVDGEAGSEDAGPGYIPVYRHAQPALVVPEEKPIPNTLSMYAVDAVAAIAEVKGWNACRAAMLQAEPVCTCPSGDGSLRWPCPVHPGSSPAILDGYVMVPKEATLDMLKAGAKQEMKGEAFQYVWQAMLAAAPQEVMKDEANNLSPK